MERQPDEEPRYRSEFRGYLEREFGIEDRHKQDVAMAIFDEVFLEKAREHGLLPAELPEPLYKMIIADEEHWLPIKEAGVTYDSGWVPVHIGGLVMEGIGQRRPITAEERAQIAEIADEYSASK
ncbi:hypothetical protein HY379_02795 [Candidatus Saccharibacteria bacterium]|nr:hypothetical protein [Candidatus Saccharibacteria bacterium]